MSMRLLSPISYIFQGSQAEPQHDKTNKMTSAPNEDSALASAQSDQILRCIFNG